MSAFSYRAINPRGRSVRGRMEAANLADLELRLRRLGLDLVHGTPVRQITWQRQRSISRRELINFCFHLEQFLRAGVPIIDSLADLRDSLHRPASGKSSATS
jgi:type IV pilus assembly protein PilC